jgi:hypothetical protein
VKEAAQKAVAPIVNAVKTTVNTVANVAKQAVNTVKTAVQSTVSTVKTVAQSALTQAKQAVDTVKTVAKSAVQSAAKAATTVKSTAATWAEIAAQKVANSINSKTSKVIETAQQKVKQTSAKTPTVQNNTFLNTANNTACGSAGASVGVLSFLELFRYRNSRFNNEDDNIVYEEADENTTLTTFLKVYENSYGRSFYDDHPNESVITIRLVDYEETAIDRFVDSLTSVDSVLSLLASILFDVSATPAAIISYLIGGEKDWRGIGNVTRSAYIFETNEINEITEVYQDGVIIQTNTFKNRYTFRIGVGEKGDLAVFDSESKSVIEKDSKSKIILYEAVYEFEN